VASATTRASQLAKRRCGGVGGLGYWITSGPQLLRVIQPGCSAATTAHHRRAHDPQDLTNAAVVAELKCLQSGRIRFLFVFPPAALGVRESNRLDGVAMCHIDFRVPLVALIIASFVTVRAEAQAPRAVATAVGCTYETCAVRVEGGLFAERLVRGAPGERVSTLGPLGGGVDLLLGGPDSAAVHAQSYVRNVKWSVPLAIAGAVALSVSSSSTSGFKSGRTSNGDVVSAIAGAVALAISVPFELRARRELSRAIWWYNASMPR
jgi:hypothetical protein